VINGLQNDFYHGTCAEGAAAGGLGNLDGERVSVALPGIVGLTFMKRFAS